MEKIKKIKIALIKNKIDGYLIPKNDEFFGEYISKYNDRLNYISKFSGSYGFALILRNTNYLFVDGRYTLQAHNQSGKIFKVITFSEKMPYEVLKKKKLSIGFDPKLITKNLLYLFFGKTRCSFKPLEKNLVDEIWKRKVPSIKKKYFKLPEKSVSESYNLKVNRISNYLKKRKADYLFVSASENNAWLLNIRGYDTKYSPIPNCHLLIDRNKNISFYCDLKKISSSIKKYLSKVKFFDFKNIDKNLSAIYGKKFIIDKNSCSFFFEEIISKNNKILKYQDPIYYLKAIKGKKEIENVKIAHIIDGAALTKYLFWLKRNYKKKKVTEISASQKLLKFRKKNKKFKFSSFPTISGTGPNGSIIHYKATKETNRKLNKGDIYLVDSGGQYEFGTTDVTRTISLNNNNKKIKDIFTRVLKGHIAVVNTKLGKNISGSIIDIRARKFLKQIGLDYPHSTGHGVGYFLNVHEGPHAISKNNKISLKEGMIVSNEPGYYKKNKFGVRIENLIYVKKNKKGKYFENLTMAPIDKDLIDISILNENEKKWLNNYHYEVFNNLKNSMNKLEILELKKACSAI